MAPSINYLPDPSDPEILYAVFDAKYSAVQQYYNNKAQYSKIDKAAATLAANNWKQWSVGAVIAKDAGQPYRAAPVAPNGHLVTWNGTANIIADSGKPVWSPDPTWNVNDWETGPTGTGEDLVRINDPARHLQGTGGFAGMTLGNPQAPAPTFTRDQLIQALQQLLLGTK